MRPLPTRLALLWSALALAGTAWAGDEPGVVVDERRAALELLLLSDGLDEPLLVGVRGSTWALSQRVERVRPDAAVRFEALEDDGTLGEQLALIMGRHGASCALSLEPNAGGDWHLRHWGACADPPGVVAPGLGGTGARVARTLLDDPRDPAQLARERHIILRDGAGDEGHPDWIAVEASGYPLSSRRFALQVGDLPTVRQLERERRWATSSTISLAAIGGAAALGGLVVMGRGFTDASGALQYERQVRAEQRAWTGVVISTSGLMLLSGVPRLARSVRQRRARPDQVYSRDQAQALVDAYNAQLDDELGVGATRPSEQASAGSEEAP